MSPSAGAPVRPPVQQVVRAGRRTNLALLGLVAGALATGTACYAVGTRPATTVVTTTHAAVGLALLLLVPWKTVIARAGLRLDPHPGRGAGLWLAGLLLVTVVTGVVQDVAGFTTVLGLAPLQVHVTAALLAVPLLVGHLVTHPQRLRRTDLGRRAALGTGLLAAGGLAATALSRSVPGPAESSTGSSETGSHAPDAMPVTQWASDVVPSAGERSARLRVRGVPVDDPAPVEEVDAVLDCTGGWYATQRWSGVRLDQLLGPLPASARSIDVVSTTGYRRRYGVEQASALLLATAVGGKALSAGHGGPRRLVAPGRRGYWWVKWVASVEVSDEPPWRQLPFPPPW